MQAIKQLREEVQEIYRITSNLKAFSGRENTVVKYVICMILSGSLLIYCVLKCVNMR